MVLLVLRTLFKYFPLYYTATLSFCLITHNKKVNWLENDRTTTTTKTTITTTKCTWNNEKRSQKNNRPMDWKQKINFWWHATTHSFSPSTQPSTNLDSKPVSQISEEELDPRTLTWFSKCLGLPSRWPGHSTEAGVTMDQEELEKYIICKSINELETLLKKINTKKRSIIIFCNLVY